MREENDNKGRKNNRRDNQAQNMIMGRRKRNGKNEREEEVKHRPIESRKEQKDDKERERSRKRTEGTGGSREERGKEE